MKKLALSLLIVFAAVGAWKLWAEEDSTDGTALVTIKLDVSERESLLDLLATKFDISLGDDGIIALKAKE